MRGQGTAARDDGQRASEDGAAARDGGRGARGGKADAPEGGKRGAHGAGRLASSVREVRGGGFFGAVGKAAPLLVFYGLAVLIMLASVAFGLNSGFDYKMYNDEGISFVSGRVTQVMSEDVEIDRFGLHRGSQKLMVRLEGGPRRGDEVDVTNSLSVEQSIYVKPGDRVVVLMDQPDESYYYASLFGRDRSLPIYGVLGAFLLILMLVGRRKGVRSAFGMAFTLVTVVFLLIPLILLGWEPAPLTAALAALIMAVSLTALSGFTRKTLVMTAGAVTGVVISALLFAAASAALHVSGFNVEDVSALVVLAQNTDIKIEGLLFAGVLLASLGAIMDVAVSVASGVGELREVNEGITANELFRSGMKISGDIIGATANTLIMAFLGTFFITILMYRVYNVEYTQLINMNTMAIEVAQAVSGACALIFTAPVTAFVASRVYGARNNTTHGRYWG
ncbi:MAG: YibE/F family protein [Clostridiales Family XIII bacterium]|nr:YibE/F family protein [Clostridiales Family XIII bacterium]